MMAGKGIAALKAFLETQNVGPIADETRVARLIVGACDELEISDHTNMRADKLWRMESPTWDPLVLLFDIERHGATVNGSSRATVYTWAIDISSGQAAPGRERRRQLSAMDKRLDVKPIAARLAEAIIASRADERFKITKDGNVRLQIGSIIPATNAQTTPARRKRLRRELDVLLKPHGWVQSINPNTYVKEGKRR